MGEKPTHSLYPPHLLTSPMGNLTCMSGFLSQIRGLSVGANPGPSVSTRLEARTGAPAHRSSSPESVGGRPAPALPSSLSSSSLSLFSLTKDHEKRPKYKATCEYPGPSPALN